MSAPRFEGSYLGAGAKISPAAVMECKICWTPYDPALGDETRQIEPGTAFLDLPHDWKCPTCDGAREQFMVVEDAGVSAEPAPDAMAEAVARLVSEFREIHNAKMRDVPFSNKALSVEAVGFRVWEGQWLGVLVTPWFMNLTLLPGPGLDWSHLQTGEKEVVTFPSGEYEFIHTRREGLGGYKGCSLFSPMAEFGSQLQATDVARAVMVALFDDKNRAETDRALEIRREREAALEAEAAKAEPAAEAPEVPRLRPRLSRRSVLSGGFSAEAPQDREEARS